jgi:hypothetical protein
MREKRALEDPFREAHRLARPEFQKLSSTRRKIDLWASKLVKLFRGQERIAYEAVAPLWKRLIGTDLLIEAYRDLMVHVPQWPLYLAGWAHAMPNRAIRELRRRESPRNDRTVPVSGVRPIGNASAATPDPANALTVAEIHCLSSLAQEFLAQGRGTA